jgi:hypothetical protein
LSECEVVLTQDPKHLEQVGYTRSRIQAVYDGKRVGQGDPDEQRTNEAVPQLRGGVLLDSGAFITTAEIEEIRRKCPETAKDPAYSLAGVTTGATWHAPPPLACVVCKRHPSEHTDAELDACLCTIQEPTRTGSTER